MSKKELEVSNERIYSTYVGNEKAPHATIYLVGSFASQLNFSVEECEDGTKNVFPSTISYVTRNPDSGEKIIIEVMDNGYFVKNGNEKIVCSTEDELLESVKKMSIKEEIHEFDYNSDKHDFRNLEEIIKEINSLIN